MRYRVIVETIVETPEGLSSHESNEVMFLSWGEARAWQKSYNNVVAPYTGTITIATDPQKIEKEY